MLNPAKLLAAEFLKRTPATLLGAGVSLSLVDFVLLYCAASRDGVLHLRPGVGLLENYGLLATILNDGVLICLAKVYCDAIQSLAVSKAIVDIEPVERSLARLRAMINMDRQYQFLMYLLLVIGWAYWLSNLGFHVLGHPDEHWAHKVFDSPDHPFAFLMSRVHNFFSWIVILPLVGHVIIYATIQLNRTFAIAARKRVLQYDLLNPDQKGGFLCVERAHLAFNVIMALLYIQITLHLETFARMRVEHVVAYATLTLLLIGINHSFLGSVYATIDALRTAALNAVKEKVYQDDKLSFEILKYCYEHSGNRFALVNFVVQAGAILFSGAVKLLPVILPQVYQSLR